ncbi:MAG: extracellular solute-binding protein, partial [Anaerolineae bacterium]|nr:extracellular solute-binding protein [Anaerolineae bacterium]
ILPAGLGSAWYISSKSKYQKEAAELLNYVFSDEVVKMWYETGVVVPVKMDANVLAGLKLTALDKFAIDILQKAAQGQGGVQLGYYVDTAAPEAFNTMMQDGFQAVLLGSKTVEQQLEDLQRLWDEGQKK